MTHGIKSQSFAAGLIMTTVAGCVAAGPRGTYQSDLQAYNACTRGGLQRAGICLTEAPRGIKRQ
jgi:hypothetical protein